MNDRIIMVAVAGLVLVACLCVAGIVVLASQGHEPPVILGLIASSCATGILGILVRPGEKPERGVDADALRRELATLGNLIAERHKPQGGGP